MGVKVPRTPRKLGSAGRELWRAITRQVADDGLELDARELAMLKAACAEADVLVTIEDALVDQPRTVRGAQGQIVAHPLIGEARRSRQAIASLLKGIGMDDPVASAPGRGGRTSPWQARAAALSRQYGER